MHNTNYAYTTSEENCIFQKEENCHYFHKGKKPPVICKKKKNDK